MKIAPALIALSSGVALAGPGLPPVSPFTETFDLGGENWKQGSGADVDWNAGVISSTADVNSAGPFGLTVFRAQDGFDSSNDAFVGNYLAGGISTVSFDVLQDSGQELTFGLRVATSANSPAFALLTPVSVSSGQWTTLTFELDFNSPFYFAEGPPGVGFFSGIMSQVGNLQISVNRPDGLVTPLVTTFSVDNFAVTPSPAGVALIGFGGLMASRRRRS